MSEDEQTHIPSIRERMAALKLNQVGRLPTSPPPTYEQAVGRKTKAPPPLPKRPGEQRSASTNNPPVLNNGRASQAAGDQPNESPKDLLPPPAMKKWEGRDEDARPSLPPRRPTDKLPPSLPPRRPSEQSLTRQESGESLSSVRSGRSSLSAASVNGQANGPKFRVRAPEYDPATLPPLPERKKTNESKASEPRVPLRPTVSAPKVSRTSSLEPPPAIPSRRPLPPRSSTTPEPAPEEPPHQPPRRSALDFALNKATDTPPPLPSNRPSPASPPPVPMSSRPNLAELNKSKPKSNGAATTNGTTPSSSSGQCLKCRDFSGPDEHAARFPRQSIPSTDISWLANQLTSPFPSATDKARAIFTWLHHNVAYDVKSFFGNCIRSKTPSETLTSGLAVCEGYAGLFSSLAKAAGLECIVVGGHGKGIGYFDPAPGSPPPPRDPTGHAWNAVRIETGWKLLDACWGAGHVKSETQSYHKAFHPAMFTMSNEEFGERHYPADNRHWFREDGTVLSWEEYVRAGGPIPAVTVFGGAEKEHCLAPRSFVPAAMNVRVRPAQGEADVVRFEFRKICPHWDLKAHLPPPTREPYLFLLKVHGVDGKNEEWLPFETNVRSGGDAWWRDVPRKKLGLPGQELVCYAQTKYLDGRDGRGLTIEEYHRTRPQWRQMGWSSVAQWRLV